MTYRRVYGSGERREARRKRGVRGKVPLPAVGERALVMGVSVQLRGFLDCFFFFFFALSFPWQGAGNGVNCTGTGPRRWWRIRRGALLVGRCVMRWWGGALRSESWEAIWCSVNSPVITITPRRNRSLTQPIARRGACRSSPQSHSGVSCSLFSTPPELPQ